MGVAGDSVGNVEICEGRGRSHQQDITCRNTYARGKCVARLLSGT